MPRCVTEAGAHATNAVAEIHAVGAARAAHWTMMDRERHRIALAKRNNLDATLHSWSLLSRAELSPREIPTRLG